MAGWTRAIVRLEGVNRMVTKGYQKGVYEWVTKGIRGLANSECTVPNDFGRTPNSRLFPYAWPFRVTPSKKRQLS